MIRSFPPHPNPLPPGERGGHSSPQQSWGVFWHILINGSKIEDTIYLILGGIKCKKRMIIIINNQAGGNAPYDRTINRRKILAIINAVFSLIYNYFSRILKMVQKNISLRGG